MTPRMFHSEAQIRDAIRRVRQGGDLHEVARGLGVHRATLGKWVRAAAIQAGEEVTRGRQPRPPTPLLVRSDVSWMDEGNCIAWPDFTEMGMEQQKRICWDGCRVRDKCREWGLVSTDESGPAPGIVYGGLSSRDLGRLRRLRREEAAKVQRMRAEVAS